MISFYSVVSCRN